MQPIFILMLYGLLFLASIFIADAAVGFVRSARGIDDDAVERRLVNQPVAGFQRAAPSKVLLRQVEIQGWRRFVPLLPRLLRLLQTSGTGLSLEGALGLMAAFSLFATFALASLLPVMLLPISFTAGVLTGTGLVLFYVTRARKKRIAKFDEQLPDAIDLIVRSLKVGHPLSGAMSVVGRELPAPISTEFAAAYEEMSYGQDAPTVLAKMIERVPVADLGYLSMAVQIQQESGGNLVESLAKLSQVIRERFRMFRKVKALTAEGRFSAWFLSIFPLALIFGIQLVKPDYYTQVMNVPIFPQLVIATVVLLTINVVAMRVITNIKV